MTTEAAVLELEKYKQVCKFSSLDKLSKVLKQRRKETAEGMASQRKRKSGAGEQEVSMEDRAAEASRAAGSTTVGEIAGPLDRSKSGRQQASKRRKTRP